MQLYQLINSVITCIFYQIKKLSESDKKNDGVDKQPVIIYTNKTLRWPLIVKYC